MEPGAALDDPSGSLPAQRMPQPCCGGGCGLCYQPQGQRGGFLLWLLSPYFASLTVPSVQSRLLLESWGCAWWCTTHLDPHGGALGAAGGPWPHVAVSSNMVRGFEAKKVRTDFNFFFNRESVLLNRDGDSFTCPLKALRAAWVFPQKLLQYPVVLGSSISRLKS